MSSDETSDFLGRPLSHSHENDDEEKTEKAVTERGIVWIEDPFTGRHLQFVGPPSYLPPPPPSSLSSSSSSSPSSHAPGTQSEDKTIELSFEFPPPPQKEAPPPPLKDEKEPKRSTSSTVAVSFQDYATCTKLLHERERSSASTKSNPVLMRVLIDTLESRGARHSAQKNQLVTSSSSSSSSSSIPTPSSFVYRTIKIYPQAKLSADRLCQELARRIEPSSNADNIDKRFFLLAVIIDVTLKEGDQDWLTVIKRIDPTETIQNVCGDLGNSHPQASRMFLVLRQELHSSKLNQKTDNVGKFILQPLQEIWRSSSVLAQSLFRKTPPDPKQPVLDQQASSSSHPPPASPSNNFPNPSHQSPLKAPPHLRSTTTPGRNTMPESLLKPRTPLNVQNRTQSTSMKQIVVDKRDSSKGQLAETEATTLGTSRSYTSLPTEHFQSIQKAHPILKNYRVLELLGEGAFGKVWRVAHRTSGIIYAMKILTKSEVIQNNLVLHTNLEREILEEVSNASPLSFKPPSNSLLNPSSLFEVFDDSPTPKETPPSSTTFALDDPHVINFGNTVQEAVSGSASSENNKEDSLDQKETIESIHFKKQLLGVRSSEHDDQEDFLEVSESEDDDDHDKDPFGAESMLAEEHSANDTGDEIEAPDQSSQQEDIVVDNEEDYLFGSESSHLQGSPEGNEKEAVPSNNTINKENGGENKTEDQEDNGNVKKQAAQFVVNYQPTVLTIFNDYTPDCTSKRCSLDHSNSNPPSLPPSPSTTSPLSSSSSSSAFPEEKMSRGEERKRKEEEERTVPFVVGLFESWQTSTQLIFVMDCLDGGSLYDCLVQNDGPFPTDVVRFYAAQMLVALDSLHRRRIIYRDLKLENILLDMEGNAYLTDMGLAHRFDLIPPDLTPSRVHSFSGTPIYLAPEVLTQQGHGVEVDWWAFGVALFIMLTEEPPFWDQNYQVMFETILLEEPQWSRYNLDPHAEDLLRQLLAKDPQRRFGSLPPQTPRSQPPPPSSSSSSQGEQSAPVSSYRKTLHNLSPAKILSAFQSGSQTPTDAEKEKEKERAMKFVETGVGRIKAHPFFQSINWDLLVRKQVKPPIKPSQRRPPTLNFSGSSSGMTQSPSRKSHALLPLKHQQLYADCFICKSDSPLDPDDPTSSAFPGFKILV